MTRRDVVKLAMIAAVLALCVLLAGRIGRMHDQEEASLVRDAIKDALMTCYAVEGAYPEDMDYLRKEYHLVYDDERFLVTYDAFASNRFPDLYVVERGAVLP